MSAMDRSVAATTCTRPRPGPMYWDWRCLNCDQEIRLHPPLWRRLLARVQNGSDREVGQ